MSILSYDLSLKVNTIVYSQPILTFRENIRLYIYKATGYASPQNKYRKLMSGGNGNEKEY